MKPGDTGTEAGRHGTPGELPYGPDGVDATLIRWMLWLTPRGRLEVLQGNIRSLMELRIGASSAS